MHERRHLWRGQGVASRTEEKPLGAAPARSVMEMEGGACGTCPLTMCIAKM
jgi:hypothetical protein